MVGSWRLEHGHHGPPLLRERGVGPHPHRDALERQPILVRVHLAGEWSGFSEQPDYDSASAWIDAHEGTATYGFTKQSMFVSMGMNALHVLGNALLIFGVDNINKAAGALDSLTATSS